MKRSILLTAAVAVALASAAWFFRWSTPVQVEKGAVVVDRWTGDVWYIVVFSKGAAKGRITWDVTEQMKE